MITLKRLVWGSIFVGCLGLAVPSAWAMGAPSRSLTVLAVPARYTVIQISFDVIQRRNAVLVSYQGEARTSEPALHVWSGTEWRPITMDDFRTSSYLRYAPARVVLVGDEETLPEVMVDAAGQASRMVLNVPSQDTASVVNSFGKVLSFRRSEWEWFAARYGLALSDDNEELRTVSWYDVPHPRSGGESVTVPPPETAGPVISVSSEEDIPAAEVLVGPASSTEGWEESAEATEAPVK